MFKQAHCVLSRVVLLAAILIALQVAPAPPRMDGCVSVPAANCPTGD